MGGGRVSRKGRGGPGKWESFMGRERWVSVGLFLTVVMPSGLGLSSSWEPVEAAS